MFPVVDPCQEVVDAVVVLVARVADYVCYCSAVVGGGFVQLFQASCDLLVSELH